jgi:hypothetical protein
MNQKATKKQKMDVPPARSPTPDCSGEVQCATEKSVIK